MSNSHFAYFLTRLAEQNRHWASDNMIKSHAPNAHELKTKEIKFADVFHELQDQHKPAESNKKISNLIESHTEEKSVTTSKRQAAMEFAQAAMINSAMTKLLSHSITEHESVLNNFRPS